MADPLGHSWALILAEPERTVRVDPIARQSGLQVVAVSDTVGALRFLRSLEGKFLACVVCALGTCDQNSCWPVLEEIQRSSLRQAFIIVLSTTAARDVRLRLECFKKGARMVTDVLPHVERALGLVATALRTPGKYTCPLCGLSDLSEDSLHTHMPLFHVVEPNMSGPCPMCGDPCSNVVMQVHVNNCHGPPERREPPQARYAAFAWCVCQRPRDGRFLLVNEPAGICGGKPLYWLPAGRVDRGESLAEAACRECLEEAGIAVRVVGVLHFLKGNRSWTLRVIFLTVPLDEEAEAKSLPDWESAGALWVAAQDLHRLSDDDYRNTDPAKLYPAVATGELKCHSIETDAFRLLEDLIRQLTAGDFSRYSELGEVWRQLQLAYPESVFSYR
mmetsp:Transcript_23732/g.55341  ORF Transcript_23732/g.55341 Transcript_23732/m.55341 type:complete len:389 (-) Transcript_23732:60-1226(-)